MNITVIFDWVRSGEITLAYDDQMIFPSPPQTPGIYCFHCSAETEPWLYIGEADNLKKRMDAYGKPGPTQGTNIRLNAHLGNALRENQHITLSIVTVALLEINGVQADADLSDVFVRRLIEDTAIVAAVMAGTRVLNRRGSKKVDNNGK